jgi:hypothetical protein
MLWCTIERHMPGLAWHDGVSPWRLMGPSMGVVSPTPSREKLPIGGSPAVRQCRTPDHFSQVTYLGPASSLLIFAARLLFVAFLLRIGPAYAPLLLAREFFASTCMVWSGLAGTKWSSSGGAGWPFLPLPISCLAYSQCVFTHM